MGNILGVLNMMDYIKPFLTYEGTLKRLPFAIATLLVIPILSTILVAIFSAISLDIVGSIATLALAVIGIFATMQRVRDAGLNTWLTLLIIVPVVNLVFYIILLFKGSKEEAPAE